MVDEQAEFEGMPPRKVMEKVVLHGATAEAEREFSGREHVRFEVHGIVKATEVQYLEDEDNPEQLVTKIQVTSMKEI